jgi:hypothetical protein
MVGGEGRGRVDHKVYVVQNVLKGFLGLVEGQRRVYKWRDVTFFTIFVFVTFTSVAITSLKIMSPSQKMSS